MYNFCNRIIFRAKQCFRAKKALADKKISTAYKTSSDTTENTFISSGKRPLFKAKESGVFLLEFTLIVPIMLFLIIGGFEMARYVRMFQVTNKLAYELSNALLRQCVNSYGANTDPTYIVQQEARTNKCLGSVWQSYMDIIAAVLPVNASFVVDVVMDYQPRVPPVPVQAPRPIPAPSAVGRGFPGGALRIFDNNGNVVGNQAVNWSINHNDYGNITNGAINPADFAIWTGISVLYQPFIQNILGFQILTGINQQVTSESVIY
jgi:hypothetical protein